MWVGCLFVCCLPKYNLICNTSADNKFCVLCTLPPIGHHSTTNRFMAHIFGWRCWRRLTRDFARWAEGVSQTIWRAHSKARMRQKNSSSTWLSHDERTNEGCLEKWIDQKIKKSQKFEKKNLWKWKFLFETQTYTKIFSNHPQRMGLLMEQRRNKKDMERQCLVVRLGPDSLVWGNLQQCFLLAINGRLNKVRQRKKFQA